MKSDPTIKTDEMKPWEMKPWEMKPWEMKPWERKLGHLLVMIPIIALTLVSIRSIFEEGYSDLAVLDFILGFVGLLSCCLRVVAIDLETAFKKALKEALENRHE